MDNAHPISRRRLPRILKPMLARLGREPFDSPDHLFELKWDGIRALAFMEGGLLRVLNRSSKEITVEFPELTSLPERVAADRVVLDGELVCLDAEGHPSYSLLRQRLDRPQSSEAQSNSVQFIAFDLLYLEGNSIMQEPLVARKNVLHNVLRPNDVVQASDVIERDGKAFFEATCQLGLEGVIAKERLSIYVPGKRSSAWTKIKRVREAEFVIGGYTFGGTKSEPFSTLLLGLYDARGRLIYVGQVGVGIPRDLAQELYSTLQQLHVTDSPFQSPPRIQKFIYWCRPELVCEVQYGEFTEEGRLAYSVFKALRDDKAAIECVIDDAIGWPSVPIHQA